MFCEPNLKNFEKNELIEEIRMFPGRYLRRGLRRVATAGHDMGWRLLNARLARKGQNFVRKATDI